MAAVAKNPAFAKKVGVPRAVGEEFLGADKGKKFKEGGTVKRKMRKFEEGGATSGVQAGLQEMAERYAGRPSKLGELRSDIRAIGRAGKAAAEMTPAGIGARTAMDLIKKMPKSYDEEKGMKKGGTVKHSDIAKDMPMMKKVAGEAVKGHEKRMHKMAKGGVTRADGCVTKGHTKGKMISMKKGGYC